jgi:hypothetical protein
MLFAAGANATHGRPRSTADKRCAVLKLLNDYEWCIWSDREIARRCHVGHQLVAELREVTGRATSERKFRSKHGGVSTMKIRKIGQKSSRKLRRAVSFRAEEAQRLALLQSIAAINETETTPGSSIIAETASTAVPKIDNLDVAGDQAYADQHVAADETLAILAEFAKFVIARIDCQGKNIIVTVTEEDAVQFRSLCGRAELAIGAELSDLRISLRRPDGRRGRGGTDLVRARDVPLCFHRPADSVDEGGSS